MAEERTYIVPLRREWLRAPRYRRSKRAIGALRNFLSRHMKADAKNVRIGARLNEAVWARSIKNPPHKVRITVQKDEKGIVRAELFGHPIQLPKVEEKKGLVEKVKEKIGVKKAVAKPVEKKPAAPAKPAKAEAKPTKPAEAKPAAKPAAPVTPPAKKPMPAEKK